MKYSLLLLFLILVASCGMTSKDVAPELAMTLGMVIDADTEEGSIRIKYIDTFTREYSWNGKTRRFKHQPRKERWYGSLGMYRPYGDGSMHAILEEGQQHFESATAAYAWLMQQEVYKDLVWNRDGLVVGWKEQARPEDGFVALSVDVWQVYINGKKANMQSGSSDRSLRVSTGE